MRIHIEEKRYGESLILRDIDLTLDAGKRVAVLGSSGIGKSTLLRIVAGLDQQFIGDIQYRPKRIGMVFQEPLLINWRNARANLVLMSGCSEAKADDSLAEVGLEGLGDRLPQELSIGQQRRVSLARALVNQPTLLIMDEAFASLDDETAKAMREIVANYADQSQCAVILATHLQDDLALANEVYAIEDCALIAKER